MNCQTKGVRGTPIINTAIISIIAQNYGAGNYERIKESYYTAIKYALFIMILSGILIFITSGIIPTFFSDNLEVNHFGKKYLQISAFVLPAYPIFFLSNGFFMALKKSENALVTNFFRNILLPVITFYVATYFMRIKNRSLYKDNDSRQGRSIFNRPGM